MKRKLLVFISILLLSCSTAYAQTQTNGIKKNQLEFSSGYTFGSLKNLSFAPVARYDYNALNHKLSYTRTTKKEKLFDVQLDYLNTDLKSALIPALNAPYSKIVLNFSSLKRVYAKKKVVIHLGLQSQTNLSSYNEWQAYDLQQEFGIAGRFTFELNEKQTLSSKLTIPVVMWRISTFEESLYSVGSYQGVFWSTAYKYALSEHFDLKVNYNFNYDRLQISNAYRELQHQVHLGITYKF